MRTTEYLDRLERMERETVPAPWVSANGGVRTVEEYVPDRVKKDGTPYKNAKYGPYWVAPCFSVAMMGEGVPAERLADWTLIAEMRNALPHLLRVVRAAKAWADDDRACRCTCGRRAINGEPWDHSCVDHDDTGGAIVDALTALEKVAEESE